MEEDRLARSLVQLGINPNDARVLKFLPIVYTAWTNGSMEKAVAERIRAMARFQFHLSEPSLRVLDGWLTKPPSPRYVLEGLRGLYTATHAQDNVEFEPRELPVLLAHAEAIARTTEQGMDFPSSVTPSEVRALREIAALLDVDNGQTWTALVQELDSGVGFAEVTRACRGSGTGV